MKTSTADKPERALSAVSPEELEAVTGGSIDLDVPQCGNVYPIGPYPSTIGSQVIIPAVQNTWTGR